jgi:hypothetical protein
MSNYNLTYWHSKFSQGFSAFISLYHYVKDNEALGKHTDSIEIFNIGSREEVKVPIKTISVESQKFIIDTTIKSIEEALSIFSDQFIVLLVSITDSMLSELIKYMFINSTESFLNILKNKEYENISRIDLAEFVKSMNMEQLLENHAEKLSSQILSGSIEKQFKRIEKISKYIIPDEMKKSFIELYALRNKIVHDLAQSNTSTKQIDFYYELCLSLVEETGKILTKMNIVFEDPVGVALKEMKDRLEIT